MSFCRIIGAFIFKRKLNTFSEKNLAEKWILPSGQKTDICVYNPITKTKVPFILNDLNYVTWYMCGPTVYDSAHLGHASCYVKFDIVRKILTGFFGLHIVQAMSVTDVDDKILVRAAQQGEDAASLARRYTVEFFEDMASLGVEPPSLRLAVTDHIPDIVAFVQVLINKRAAYVANGSVYFDTSSDARYGKLSGATVEEEREVRPDGEKRSPRDFALWKAAKAGEAAWLSPWGAGRPGWHIECSAMASAVFGHSVDIHSGGVDLLFPHHENEEAQSCLYHTTPQWVNYWLHAGQLRVNSDHKMSKSLGNTVSVRQFLSRHTAAQFRMFCLLSHYRRGVEYSPAAMEKAVAVSRRLEAFLHACRAAQRGPGSSRLSETQRRLLGALADDFDTGSALAAILDLVSDTNKELQLHQEQGPEASAGNAGVLAAVADFVRKSLARLGVHFPSLEALGSANQAGGGAVNTEAVLEAVVQFRSRVRLTALQEGSPAAQRCRLLQACDELRDELRLAGVTLKDHGQLSSWSVSSQQP
ncbi:cysteine--tRNA ligase, mitochondrial isoform X2 [Bacillus rossius redtenbacheri]|uniref:cysteine--tRNA ligase, mitochondrial isoform X2 n=1 Tax=Bacillus rossius redtenbacheri TaxID=93214 RepID=UPI002FDC918B